jgi:hypothetical protein
MLCRHWISKFSRLFYGLLAKNTDSKNGDIDLMLASDTASLFQSLE